MLGPRRPGRPPGRGTALAVTARAAGRALASERQLEGANLGSSLGYQGASGWISPIPLNRESRSPHPANLKSGFKSRFPLLCNGENCDCRLVRLIFGVHGWEKMVVVE